MKKLFTVILLSVLAFAKAYSQQSHQLPEKMSIVQTIDRFFVAFHNQDTLQLKNLMVKYSSLSSVSVKDGESTTSVDSIDSFLTSIAKIPKSVDFKEEILDMQIYENKYTATVLTPYTFNVNGRQSHSGTNIFVLFKVNGVWKIASIADSRVYE